MASSYRFTAYGRQPKMLLLTYILGNDNRLQIIMISLRILEKMNPSGKINMKLLSQLCIEKSKQTTVHKPIRTFTPVNLNTYSFSIITNMIVITNNIFSTKTHLI